MFIPVILLWCYYCWLQTSFSEQFWNYLIPVFSWLYGTSTTVKFSSSVLCGTALVGRKLLNFLFIMKCFSLFFTYDWQFTEFRILGRYLWSFSRDSEKSNVILMGLISMWLGLFSLEDFFNFLYNFWDYNIIMAFFLLFLPSNPHIYLLPSSLQLHRLFSN